MALVLGFKNHATEYYGTNEYDTGEYKSPSVWLTNIPRLKFNWTVEFEMNYGDPAIAELLQGNDLVGSITNIAKTVQLPDLNFDTQTVNQYNKRRKVHVKGEWQPVQITFHDNVSNRLEKILQAYRNFYWASEDPNQGLLDYRSRDQTSDNFNSRVGMTAVPFATDNFFKSISINREWQGKSDQYILINPKIVQFQHDTLDYSSNDPVGWTITFDYEAVETRLSNKPTIPGGYGPNYPYTSYQSDAQANAAAGTGLDNASNTGGNGPELAENGGGFSGEEDMSDLADWQEPGTGDSASDPMAAYDEFAGVDDAVAKQAEEKASWKNQMAEKFSSFKENVAGAYQSAQNFSVGGIPVGKAINPQNIGTTIALGTSIYATGGKALKNPAFLLGAANKVASGIPGASQYMGGITAGLVGVATYQKGGLKGLAVLGGASAASWLMGQGGKSQNTFGDQTWGGGSKTPYSPMQSFIGGDGNAANGRRF